MWGTCWATITLTMMWKRTKVCARCSMKWSIDERSSCVWLEALSLVKEKRCSSKSYRNWRKDSWVVIFKRLGFYEFKLRQMEIVVQGVYLSESMEIKGGIWKLEKKYGSTEKRNSWSGKNRLRMATMDTELFTIWNIRLNNSDKSMDKWNCLLFGSLT